MFSQEEHYPLFITGDWRSAVIELHEVRVQYTHLASLTNWKAALV
jgi:hypothetical protein